MSFAGAMLRTSIPVTSLLAVGCFLVPAYRARTSVGSAAEHYNMVTTQAEQASVLRALHPAPPEVPAHTPAIAARISAALTASGLPPDALAHVTPESEAAAGSHGGVLLVRRRIGLALNGITLPQLGSFLRSWRDAEPDWVPSSLDLTPIQPRPGFPGGDLPLNVSMTIEAVFRTPPGATP